MFQKKIKKKIKNAKDPCKKERCTAGTFFCLCFLAVVDNYLKIW